ncbi:hypothetical protein [Agaribacter flavus]|uniref:Uncharacterized protein n=1 Tax=Agaribacter flavus TaxID=1902781 RepID=A0ABV7FMM8_9ALTE
MTLTGTATKAGISSRYESFVNIDTGLINKYIDGFSARHVSSRDAGHIPLLSYKMVVEKDIHQGESWQLAACLAHVLYEQGRLCEYDVEDGDTVFIATGMVDPVSLSVNAISFLPQKALRASRALAEWRDKHCEVRFFVPNANYRQPLPDVPFEFSPVSELRDLFEALYSYGLQAPLLSDDLRHTEYSSHVFTKPLHAQAKTMNAKLENVVGYTDSKTGYYEVDNQYDDNSQPIKIRLAASFNKPVLLFSLLFVLFVLFGLSLLNHRTTQLLEYRVGIQGCSDAVAKHYDIKHDISTTLPTVPLKGLCALQLSIDSQYKSAWLLAESGALISLSKLSNGHWNVPLPSWQNSTRRYTLLLSKQNLDAADFQSFSAYVASKPSDQAMEKLGQQWFAKQNYSLRYFTHTLVL